MSRKWRLLGLGLAVLMFLAGCSVAEGPQAPLRILVDLEQRGMIYEGDLTECVDNMMGLLNAGLPQTEKIDYTLEILPRSGEERTLAIQRLRVEVMAGQGPDVYLISTPSINHQMIDDEEDPTTLFPYPDVAMRSGMFLPLDELMEHPEHMEPDRFIPAVVEAGRWDQHQLILPMTFSLPVTMFHREEVDFPQETLTWTQQAVSDTPAWRAAAFWSGMGTANTARLGTIFGRMVDYESGTLLMTERELAETCRTLAVAVSGRFHHEEVDGNVPAFYQTMLSPYYNRDSASAAYSGQKSSFDEEDALTMIPVFNQQGGVTATITCWAAVDAHTRRREEACRVLDYLFSRNMQQANTSGPAQMIWRLAAADGLPIHGDILSFDAPFGFQNLRLTEENYRELSRVRELISTAQFTTRIDVELEKTFDQIVYTSADDSKERISTVDQTVQALYKNLEKMLGES